MLQLFPHKTITTVSYGTDDNGFPTVLIACSDGSIATLTADGYAVDPEFKLRMKGPPSAAWHNMSSPEGQQLDELLPPPYPFCRTPELCAGRGYCPNDPACND